jgi:hypothetical protein
LETEKKFEIKETYQLILELINQILEAGESAGEDYQKIEVYIETNGALITESMDKLDAAIDMESVSVEVVASKLMDLTMEIIIWLFKVGIRENNYKSYIVKAMNRVKVVAKYRKIILEMTLSEKSKTLIFLDDYDLINDKENVESDYINIMIRMFKIHLGSMMALN